MNICARSGDFQRRDAEVQRNEPSRLCVFVFENLSVCHSCPIKFGLLLIILFLMLGSVVMAQEEVTAVITTDRNELRVGDVVTLTLMVQHPEDMHLLAPELPKNWGLFEVRGQSPLMVTDNGDGSQTSTQAFEVTLWAPGSYQTPLLVLSLVDEDGIVSEVTTVPTTLTVLSVLTEDDLDLRDIKPQAVIESPPVWPWLLLAGLAAVVAWWLWRKLRGQEVAEQIITATTRSIDVITLAELDRVEALNLPAQKRYKEHYTLISEVLRRYLEDGFHVLALEQTTDEVGRALSKTVVLSEQQQNILNILRQADLVKFARVKPEEEAAQQLPAEGRQFVVATRSFLPDDPSQLSPLTPQPAES